MTDTLKIFGTEYTGVTGIKATDDNDNVLTYIRPQGTKSISQNGTGIDVTAFASVDVSVQSSDAYYTKTVIVPQQTFSGARTPLIPEYTGGLISGEYYVITLDNLEYLCTASTQWSAAVVIGDFNLYYGVPSEYNYPFAVGYVAGDTAEMDCAFLDTNSHSIKVEHLVFVD